MEHITHTINDVILRLEQLRDRMPLGGSTEVILFDLTDEREVEFDIMQGDEVVIEFR